MQNIFILRGFFLFLLLYPRLGYTENLCKSFLKPQDTEMNRRSFLINSASLVLTFGLNLSAGKLADKFFKNENQMNKSVLDDPYTRTMIEQNLLTIGELVALNLIPNSGNASLNNVDLKDLITKNPLKSYSTIVLLAPTIEELLFRGLPYKVFGEPWTVGLLSSILFAGAHNINDGKLDFSKIPINQFIGGVFFWYLIRERGLNHSILAHMAHNNSAFLTYYLSNLFPKKE